MIRAPGVLLFGLASGVAGIGFGAPSLLVLGAGLSILATALAAWVELATPRRLERAPGPAQVIEGENYPLVLRAKRRRLPLPGGQLRDSLLDDPVIIGARWNGQHRADVVLERRGRRKLEPARLAVGDPLGLHFRTVESGEPADVLVLPRIEPVLAAGRGGGGRGGALTGIESGASAGRRDERAVELEIDGLRPYRRGSPAARIHWPAVARTGELIERRLVAGADSVPLVVLDASRPSSPAALDQAVRAAASLSFHLARSGGCALLLPAARVALELDTELRRWPNAHARLPLVTATRSAPALGQAVRGGAVFWISAAAAPSIPRPVLRGAATRYLVGPAYPSERRPVAFTVAGCTGVRVSGQMVAARRRAA